MNMVFNKTEQAQLKKIQARFFNGNVLAQIGHFVTKEEADVLRKDVLQSYKTMKFKK